MKEILLTTYKELDEFLDKFINGDLQDNILLIGKGGLSKSYHLKKAENVLKYNGHTTPLNAFQQGYHHREKNIIWDDIDDIFRNVNMVKLLKQFCELDKEKDIYYGTTRAMVVPERYQFLGHNLLIMNNVNQAGDRLKPLFTRFLIVRFQPSHEEIYRYLETYADNREVLLELKTMLPLLDDFNLRTYEHLDRMYNAELDWREYLYPNKKLKEIAELMKKYDRDVERIEHFSGKKTQFYYWKKKLGGNQNGTSRPRRMVS